VLAPRVVLATDFTGPGGATKRGRRQEPRTTATPVLILRLKLLVVRRVPAAVLLRFAIWRANNKIPSSEHALPESRVARPAQSRRWR